MLIIIKRVNASRATSALRMLTSLVLIVINSALISSCSSNYTLGDLLSGGPATLQGTPDNSALVLVNVWLMPPAGEMPARPLSLSAEKPYLENIDTGEQITYTDERWGYVVFSGVKPGQYRYRMPAMYFTTIDTREQYKKKPEEHRQRYDYNRGDVWQTVIRVTEGDLMYHGRIAIAPEKTSSFAVSLPIRGEQEATEAAVADVAIRYDAGAEKKAWQEYFLGVYAGSVWESRVKQRLAELN